MSASTNDGGAVGVSTGKIGIVTGASSCIGRAAAKLFANEGARLVVTARRQNELDTLIDEIASAGGEARPVAGDAREESTARALVDTAVEQFGGLDFGINNAGTTGEMAPLPDLSLAGWRETIDTNLTAAFLAARFQIPAMLERGGGSLVFTSTFVGHTVGFPGMSAYAASKAGLIGLVQVIAAEFGARGIRANALLPGGWTRPWGTVANTPDTRAFIEGLHAVKRLATPEEIAQSALYLASDQSSFTTGAALLVDGGVSITRM